MGLRFIVGTEFAEKTEWQKAVLWCSTTGCAFGLTFSGTESKSLSALAQGQAFLAFAAANGVPDNGDVRALNIEDVIKLQESFFATPESQQEIYFGDYMREVMQ